MKAVFILSRLALKEYYRRKLFIVTFLSMFIVAGTGLLSNPFTLGVQTRFMSETALVYIRFYSVILAVALAASSLSNEIERKTIYPFLAEPIGRGQYLWGKFLGVAVIVIINNLILASELILILKLSGGGTHLMVFSACFLIVIEALVITGLGLWFSTRATAPVSFALVVLIYVIGDLSHIYVQTLTTGNLIMRWILAHLKSILPYFEYFSIRSAVIHEYPVRFSYIANATLYGLLYIGLIMLLAELSFSRKDL